MKSKSKLLVMAAAMAGAAVMYSCDDDTQQQEYDGMVRFSTSIEQAATAPGSAGSRASGVNWTPDDKIGIYMVENKTTTVIMDAANKKYNAEGGIGQFKAVPGNEIYYPTSGNVDFIAYYPWKVTGSGGIENDLYPINVSDQSTQADIDLMWAHAISIDGDGGYNKYHENAVELQFSHKLTRLILKVVPGANTGYTLADLKGMDISIIGMNTQNTFNVKTAEFGTPQNTANFTPAVVQDGEHYEAIILERKVENKGDVKIVFTVKGVPYTWEVPQGTEFKSGEQHEWKITIHRLGLSVTGVIKPWIVLPARTGQAE